MLAGLVGSSQIIAMTVSTSNPVAASVGTYLPKDRVDANPFGHRFSIERYRRWSRTPHRKHRAQSEKELQFFLRMS